MKSVLLLFLVLPITAPLADQPLLEAINRAQPSAEALARARRQLNNPPPAAIEKPLFVPPFHQHHNQASRQPDTFCQHCHGGAPHRKNPLKRAYLNAHTRQIACETCHWRPQAQALSYRRLPAAEGGLIVPWKAGQSLAIAGHDSQAMQFIQQWDQASLTTRIHLKAKIHQPLEAKGLGCRQCHQPQAPLLDFEALGYSVNQANELRLHPVPRFVEKAKPTTPGAQPQRIDLRELLP